MPYLAQLPNGDYVTPFDVSGEGLLYCPSCSSEMALRKKHYNRGKLISRHFFHKSSIDCSGESDIHVRMKTIARSTLNELFETASVSEEVKIRDRFADVLAEFPAPIKPYGNGIAVEVQHKHNDKNIGWVTQQYLDAGYSVYWAYLSDFDKGSMEFAQHRFRKVWPAAVPDHDPNDYYPDFFEYQHESRVPQGKRTEHSVESRVRFPLDYYRWHRIEVISPEAAHQRNWTQLEKVGLHGKGNEIAYFNLFSTPQNELVLEFHTKDSRFNRGEFIPAYIRPSCALQVQQFVDDVRHAIDTDAVSPTGSWNIHAQVQFAGTEATDSWLTFGTPPDGSPRFIMGRADEKGNMRTVSVEYRRGDNDRIRELPKAIAKYL